MECATVPPWRGSHLQVRQEVENFARYACPFARLSGMPPPSASKITDSSRSRRDRSTLARSPTIDVPLAIWGLD